MSATILIVDDERNTREGLQLALEEEFDVYIASNGEEAFRLMEVETFDVILTDLRMTGISGMRVIEQAMSQKNQPACIMMTAYGSVEVAVEAMRRGAFDFMTKPVNLENLEILIRRAIKSRSISKNPIKHEDTPPRPVKDSSSQKKSKSNAKSKIIGHSAALDQVLEQVTLVAKTKTSVLINGETGTGKELIAQAIHDESDRHDQPFIAVHCAALAENLLESELFGHEKGAFTGASEKRIGRFEAANNGTLFLDEIGEIDASIQVKLLRFLETRTIERLGGGKTIPVNIRLVCATNRNLEKMVEEGSFREDVLYRLNVVTIRLPSLRERKEDIIPLIEHYSKQFAQEYELPTVSFSSDAIEALTNYNWPGNIRELRNFCESNTVMKQGQLINRNALDGKFLVTGLASPQADHFTNSLDKNASTSPTLSKVENEKQLIHEALQQANGNKSKAAELLGISRRTLHRKLNQWPELE